MWKDNIRQYLLGWSGCILVLAGCATTTAPATPSGALPDEPVAVQEADAESSSTLEVPATPDAADQDATAQPDTEPAATATTAVVLIPTATTSAPPPDEPTATPTDWLATASVQDGLYILGNPNAPIRLVDYSDFL